MSPPYLSKIEHGEFPPPAEKKLRALAFHLGLSADALLAHAGKVARDIRVIINNHPEAWTEFLRNARSLQDDEIRQLAKSVLQDAR
jgi:transcriptional regulator with XRE-family HTH domain